MRARAWKFIDSTVGEFALWVMCKLDNKMMALAEEEKERAR